MKDASSTLRPFIPKPAMTPKERLLAALHGQQTDRLPWSPFLAYWWEAQPEAFRARGELDFLQSIGADPLLRGAAQLHLSDTPGLETHEVTRDGQRHTTFSTPVGTLTQLHRYVPQGNTWFLTEHPVKTSQDVKVLQWINEHMRINGNGTPYGEARVRLGESGLILPLIGTYGKSSFQSLVEHWIGTEELTYLLADDPEPLEACLEVMQARSKEIVRLAVQSEAEAFLFWEDSSTQNITPTWFSTYIAPELGAWADLIHGEGKLLVHHACGHLRDLLHPMAATGIDVIESISPPPTGNIELWEARDALGPKPVLIGGIEPTTFLNSTELELECHVTRLMEKMGTTGWILANSDSCPPGVSLGKFRLVTRLAREYSETH
jgi:uroporphyrinogen-III decarboxylase